MTTFETLYLYLQYMKIKVRSVRKIANKHLEAVYSALKYKF